MIGCHSALDAESRVVQNVWIPAFAGMTTLDTHLGEYHFAKQSQSTPKGVERKSEDRSQRLDARLMSSVHCPLVSIQTLFFV